MSKGKTKSKAQIYADTVAKLEEDELTAQAAELEPFKDAWELSTTAKTWIKETAKETFYGYEKQIENKYMDKGHQNEETAIKMLADLVADIVDKKNGVIIDIKNAWDISTFPAFKEDVNKKVKEAGYDWQQKGYLILWKLQKAFVCYCITDTPAELVPDWEDIALHQVEQHDPNKRVSWSDEIF
jgi:hypothetical protein